jgi:Ribosomal protein S10p/S20e
MEVNSQKYIIYKMKYCQISVSSNNLNSLKSFFLFCFYNKNIHLFLLKKYFKRKQKNKILTILKSPHINKKAQEQFEQKIFLRKYILYSQKLPQWLVLIKKIKTCIFSDIKIEIKFIISSNVDNQFCSPDNFKLNILEKKLRPKTIVKTNSLIKIMDFYGELLKQNE